MSFAQFSQRGKGDSKTRSLQDDKLKMKSGPSHKAGNISASLSPFSNVTIINHVHQ